MARCTANPDQLDADGAARSHVHMEALLEAFDLDEVWDAYGIVGDLIVSILSNLPLLMN